MFTVPFLASVTQGGGGTSHMKGVGMLVGNFELNDLGVAQAFFDP